MEKIVLKFSVQHSFDLLSKLVVTLTMDDKGKQYIVKREGMLNIRHFPESERPDVESTKTSYDSLYRECNRQDSVKR